MVVLSVGDGNAAATRLEHFYRDAEFSGAVCSERLLRRACPAGANASVTPLAPRRVQATLAFRAWLLKLRLGL